MRPAPIATLILAALAAGPAAADCIPTETELCLAGGRFRAVLEWHDPYNGGSGAGRAAPITEDSGYFWFFRQSNLEVVAKVLDGRPVNRHYWVFGAALTTVEHWLEIADTDYLPAVPGDPRLLQYDATRPLSSAGGEAWGFIARIATVHVSQYPPAAIAALAGAPAARRRVHLVPASSVVPADPAYQGLCGGGS